MSEMNPTYSVVLPIYNEETCLEEVIKRVETALNQLQKPYEIICVDDGSSDGTWSIIEGLNSDNSSIKGIKFSRNFGHQLSIYAGIKHTLGSYVAVMDADGQDPPELLDELFAKCESGYDVVYAIRQKRKERLFKRFCYKIFYLAYKIIVPFKVPLDSGDFAVFNRNVADFISKLSEKNPFIRGLRSWHGGKQIGVEYERDKRSSGEAKYTFAKLMGLALNASISFSKFPIRLISMFGICISLLSFFFGLYLVSLKLTVNIDLQGWASTALLIIFFGGLNLFVLGIIGEYIGDIFSEVKNRPAFLINKTIGIS